MFFAFAQFEQEGTGEANHSKTRRTDVPASTEDTAMMAALIADWIAGDLEPSYVSAIGTNIAGTRKVSVPIPEVKDGVTTYGKVREEPLAAKHVVGATLFRQTLDGGGFDGDLKPVEPFVRVHLEDGSKVHLPCSVRTTIKITKKGDSIKGKGA